MRRLKKAFLVLLLLPFQIQNTDQLNIGDFNVKEKTLLEIFSLNNFWLLPQTEMSENFTKFLFICQLVVLIQQKQIVHNIALANKRAVEGTRDNPYEIEYININPIIDRDYLV